jgi:hypothetical protein
VTYYVLFFIHLESRRVDIAGITVRPDELWMKQMARNVTMEGCGALRDCRYLLYDRDSKYTQSFRAIIASGRVEPLVLPARSPNLNAYAERWVRSVKEECLSKVISLASVRCDGPSRNMSNTTMPSATRPCHRIESGRARDRALAQRAHAPTGARREPRGGCPGQCSRSGRERENDRAATRAGDVLLGAGRHLVDARPAQRPQTLHHSIPRRSRVTSHQPWTRAAPCSVGDSAT